MSYRAVLFDLFDTLVWFDRNRLPEVRVNGKPAEVLSAVGLPGTVGGYQVNFRLPADTVTGSATLQLSAGMAVDTSVKLIVQ